MLGLVVRARARDKEKNSNLAVIAGVNKNRKMPEIAEIANFWMKGKIAK